MIETVLSAWSLAGVLSRFYSLLGGALGISVVSALLGPAGRPSEVVAAALRAITIRVPETLANVSQWLIARESVVTPAAALVAVTALLWSAGFLARNVYDFDKVRGPATAWIALAVMAEASGTETVIRALVWAALTTVAALAFSGWRHYRSRFGVQDPEQARLPGRVAGFMWGGAAVTLVLPLIGLLHGLGGMTPPKSRPKSTARGSAS